MPEKAPNIVDASPTKRFFVEMLTRDIELNDALLDLLDNCVDGIVRQEPKGDHPYQGFWAKIELKPERLLVEDNCGGIPKDIAKKVAFRMGRPAGTPEDGAATVGLYGIGMKRAIFKMGQRASVVTATTKERYQVLIPKEWLKDDATWQLHFQELALDGEPGTRIEVKDLLPAVRARFGEESFVDELRKTVETHFRLIIQKGFKVTINGADVTPTPLRLLLAEEDRDEHGEDIIAPYVFQGKHQGVGISIWVGFYNRVPSLDEAEAERIIKRTRDEAGWTVVCNDRVVVYCDKTRLTGWGDGTVPGFHPQFNSITGLAQFTSAHPASLPLNTTKRGLEASSDVYLYARKYMMEGTKLFTSYTNRWKTRQKEERVKAKSAKPVALDEVENRLPKTGWKNVSEGGRRFIPSLPKPQTDGDQRYIRFRKPMDEIRKLGSFLLNTVEAAPSEVGEAAFDWALKRAK